MEYSKLLSKRKKLEEELERLNKEIESIEDEKLSNAAEEIKQQLKGQRLIVTETNVGTFDADDFDWIVDELIETDPECIATKDIIAVRRKITEMAMEEFSNCDFERVKIKGEWI